MSRFRLGAPVAIALLLGAVAAFPLGILASHQFLDVPDSNAYHDDIDAIADVGVTTGCGGGNYCPSALVTREQMAAFMNRLGALGPGKVPVVNADKVDGHDAVLAAETIVNDQMGAWLLGSGSALSVTASAAATTFTRGSVGAVHVFLALPAPGTIGDVTYGLQSVRICYGVSTNTTITVTQVHSVANATEFDTVIDDGTDRPLTSAGCYTVTDAAPESHAGAVRLDLTIAYTAAASANISTVRTTWVPVAP
jgi:hypothetical protein